MPSLNSQTRITNKASPRLSKKSVLTVRNILFCLAFSIAPLLAAEESIELKVKAGYIYNFTRFIQWSAEIEADPSQPFSVCFLGSNPFYQLLHPIERKIIKERSITLVQLAQKNNFELVKNSCRILFISKSMKHEIPSILQSLPTKNLLTVSDADHFIQVGGIADFKIENNRVALQIHQHRLNNAGMTMNARILSVARIITDEE